MIKEDMKNKNLIRKVARELIEKKMEMMED